MRTIVLAHNECYDYEKDYRAIYGDDTIVWVWFDGEDLNDTINIALNQVKNCNRVVIEK